MATIVLYKIFPLLSGWLADRIWGDPSCLPHPIVGFGKMIAYWEKKLNKGKSKLAKGAVFAISLITLNFLFMWLILYLATLIHPYICVVISAVIIFYCLAGKTLIDEVRHVFIALDQSLDAGRKQVARIVGRDTSNLTLNKFEQRHSKLYPKI